MSLFVEDGLISDAANGQQVLTLSSAMFVQVFGQTACEHVAVVLIGRRDEHIRALNPCFDQGLTVEHVAVEHEHVEGLCVFDGPRIHVEKNNVVLLFFDEGFSQAQTDAARSCNHHQHVITSGPQRVC